MDRKEFDQVMEILEREYDPTGSRGAYGPSRKTAIFKAFEGYSQERFSRVVMRAFESERLPPMARDLQKISEIIRVEEHEERKRKERASATKSMDRLTEEERRRLSDSEESRQRAIEESRNFMALLRNGGRTA